MAVWQTVNSSKLSYGLRFDPEFYQPKYIELEEKLLSFCREKIINCAGLSVEPFDPTQVKTFNYIEISDISLDLGNVNFNVVDAKQAPDRAKFLMHGGEILVSTVRPNRSAVGLLHKNYQDFVVSSGFAPLKSINEDFRAFLFIWFKTKLITEWLTRYSTASMYPAVAVQDILEAPIFKPSKEFLSILNEKIERQENLLYKSKKLYPEAEQELLERMEWDKIDTKHILDYSTTSKKIFESERIDPEFYQPKFENLIKHLKKIGAIKLGDFCPMPNRGSLIKYYDNGDILVINSSDLGSDGIIDIENVHKTNKNELNSEANKDSIVSQYDLIFYAIGAYAGRTNCYLEKEKAFAGNNVLVIKPDKNICNPVYLALFLNSKVGLMLSEKYAAGSAQKFFHPQSLIKYPIFIPQNKNGKPDLEWQKRLAEKVVQAYNARKEAKQKLQEAKELVEKEIEKLIKR